MAAGSDRRQLEPADNSTCQPLPNEGLPIRERLHSVERNVENYARNGAIKHDILVERVARLEEAIFGVTFGIEAPTDAPRSHR